MRHDDLRLEVEQLYQEVTRLRSETRSPTVSRRDLQVSAGLGCLAGMFATAVLSTVLPPLQAQGTSITGCVVPSTNYLRIATTCTADEKLISILTPDAAKDAKGAKPGPAPVTRFTAPFEVVDEKGVVIVRVASPATEPRGLRVFNHAGKQVAVMNTLGDGGLIKAIRDGGNDEGMSIAAGPEGPALTMTFGGVPRATIANGAKANPAFRVFNEQKQLLAGFGLSTEGAGVASVHDTQGRQTAVMNGLTANVAVRNSQDLYVASLSVLANGKGVVQVYNDSREPVAVLTQGVSGGGMLQLTDAGGTPMVEAGTTAGGVGVVRTGPMALPLLPGVPGSFIIGKK